MKKAIGPVFRGFDFDRSSTVPLYRQLYGKLREALISGTLPPGSRLPSTRSLAEDLTLSRNTVAAAFERLIDDGFIDSRVGDGSYVSHALLEERDLERPGPVATPVQSAVGEGGRALSRRGEGILRSVLGRDPLRPRAFSVGVPALDAFPLKIWQRLVSRHARRMTAEDLGHGSPQGDPRLRRLIALHLTTARGVRCTADEILILPSAQLGLDLVGRLLVDPGDRVWIEEPGYLGARGALQAAGAHLIPVPIDEEGLQVDLGRRMASEARLAYVTPSHQFPLGGSMSLQRRLQLLAWADGAGAWIIEDDYDSEYRYAGASAQALQGLDRTGRVLYLGTFSKVLFPAIRVAYLVVPENLVEAFVTARFLMDGHVYPAIQVALADFIEAGHLVGHLRRMRALYRERRDTLLAESERRFSGLLRFAETETGMHMAARLLDGEDQALATAAAARGLDLTPLSRYFLGSEVEQGLIFGYAHVEPQEIVRACGLLQEIGSSWSPRRPSPPYAS